MVAVAIGGAAIVGAAGSVAASKSNSKAIGNAQDSSLQANRESIAAQKEALDKQIAAQQQALTQGIGFQTSALNQSNAYNTQAYNNSGKLQTDVLNQNYGILNPFAQTGYSSMNQINGILGLPQQQAYTPKDIKFTPINAQPIAAPVTPTTTPATPNPQTPAGATGPAPQPNSALSGAPQNQQLIDALRAQYQQQGMR